MARCGARRRFPLLLDALAVAFVLAAAPAEGDGQLECPRPPVIFNFGDSNSDTGGLQAGMGYLIGQPHGRRFPGGAAGRFCDGRLIVDFLCERLKKKYLSPYLQALGSDFSGGANFAIGGSTALPGHAPFSLAIQVRQFLHFRSSALKLICKGGARNLIDEEGFKNAIYLFDIGQNDLSGLFQSSTTPSPPASERVPSVLAAIESAIQTIYSQGGRRFWVHGTGPLGCLPQKVAAFGGSGAELDAAGCLAALNAVARAFNEDLSLLCDRLAGKLTGATIVFTDMFAVKYALISNYNAYGFESPLTSCCGYGGGRYNYNPNIGCGNPAARACADGARFISWDGVHYSEAANEAAAAMILSSSFSKPPIRLDSFCAT